MSRASAISKRMRAIRSHGNRTTEVAMALRLRALKLRGWRRHQDYFGRPDFCWPFMELALFVDGCFWHGCPYCKKLPKNYDPYWMERIAKNKRRDVTVNKVLKDLGWKVVRIWECQVHTAKSDSILKRAVKSLQRRE